jgi:hypothetical protein
MSLRNTTTTQAEQYFRTDHLRVNLGGRAVRGGVIALFAFSGEKAKTWTLDSYCDRAGYDVCQGFMTC